MPNRRIALLRISLVCLPCLQAALLSGCSRSNRVADNAPVDIRGEPINPPASQAVTSTTTGTLQATMTAKPVPASNAAEPEKATDEKKTGDLTPVSFDKLASFEFVMPDETVTTNGLVSATSKSNDQFPPAVKALDQARVSLKGFMLPLKVENGL